MLGSIHHARLCHLAAEFVVKIYSFESGLSDECTLLVHGNLFLFGRSHRCAKRFLL